MRVVTDGLIADYRPGSFLLAAPRHSLLATGAQAVVDERDPDELSARVTKLLVDSPAPLAVGALPFDRSAAPHLVLPEAVRWSGPLRPTSPATAPVAAGAAVTPLPSGEDYERSVARAVTRLRAGELDKVVLARTLRLDLPDPVEVRALLANLARDNATGYTYAVDLPGGRTLVGATPEMLLTRTGLTVEANPLAGSIPRHPDPVQDRLAAEELLASAKDHEEHRVVVSAVVEALRPYCRSLTVPERPSLVSTSAVWHLSTRITGVLADPEVTSLRLASALHPTPAVCGAPFGAATATIAELEPFDRGFYAGAIGWCDVHGDGQWVVGIRCAELAGQRMTLYAGAGIMPASRPDLELAETSAKFATLLRAMGMTVSPVS
ncbi:isochorismate synthase [Actinophytocola xinjiangensis]|uniref:isochorismate synthase n=1 Tax=Actinophytocola xinjiangensis TaxID=485602 RepID=A0A7Z0WKR0_9PSEU|nr:isochorismate synthase [Actinophytocola xinjiangensis]